MAIEAELEKQRQIEARNAFKKREEENARKRAEEEAKRHEEEARRMEEEARRREEEERTAWAMGMVERRKKAGEEAAKRGEAITTFFSYDELASGNIKGIDVTQKELYLCPEEFEPIFKIAKEDYLALKKWKRAEYKKATGLY
jgi:hypothetical protein